VFRVVHRFVGSNPFVVGAVYFLASFGVTYMIGHLTGELSGRHRTAHISDQLLDYLNLAVVAPVGAGLLCHLYNTIQESFLTMQRKELVRGPREDSVRNLLEVIQSRYDSMTAVIISVLLSGGINVFNYLQESDSWLGVNGGITGLYGRVFIFINFTMIFLIVYKCLVTVWALQKTMALELKVEPIHPDRSGGLSCFGQVAMATNSFLSLIMIFCALLLTFDPHSRGNPAYVTMFLMFYAGAIYSFFASLSKAHDKMKREKDAALERLADIFRDRYSQFVESEQDGHHDMRTIEEISAVEGLYAIAEKMPVWPFDVA
jgi:hypothetical protein